MSLSPADAYAELIRRNHEVALIDSISSTLNWDDETYLPAGGKEHRANQQALLARMSHEQFTAPRIGELLEIVGSSDMVRAPDSIPAANVRELRRSYDRLRKLPAALVEELTRTAVLAQAAWVDARKRSHFPTFAPWLEKLLALKRREAECVGFASNPYDALLDVFEPGETAAGVQKVFDALRPRLVELIGKIRDSGKVAPVELLQRKYPVPLQDAISREAAAAVGFNFHDGRVDVTVHPFCSGLGPGDTRITTRFDENYFGDAFFSVLHEVGHALYEQGLPKKEHFGEPVAESVSLGVHESQSRMWENLVGRGAPFWSFFFPKLRQTFGSVVADIDPQAWLFAINDVRPSLIRTEADEATYNLHVMLRFELEQAMLAGDVKVADVPAAWNQRMQAYLGLTPPDDARGCLQDVHWSHGALGYFPTYALGNLYAAQFFEQAQRDVRGLEAGFERGEFQPLLAWLREKIHRHGKRYTASELIQRVTGKHLSADPLMRHLENKARRFYGI
jgi:carboxypeptidase Taq